MILWAVKIDIMTHSQLLSALAPRRTRLHARLAFDRCLVWVFTLQTYTGERASIEHVRCFSHRR